jgi:hypothetical protein
MAHIKTYSGDTVLGVQQIDPQGDYAPNFNQDSLQKIIVKIDDKFGKDNWTSFEYIKDVA